MNVLALVAIWLAAHENTVALAVPVKLTAASCSAVFSHGQCVPLLQCRDVMGEILRGNTAILRDVRCGYQNYQPLVCCGVAPGANAIQRPVNSVPSTSSHVVTNRPVNMAPNRTLLSQSVAYRPVNSAPSQHPPQHVTYRPVNNTPNRTRLSQSVPYRPVNSSTSQPPPQNITYRPVNSAPRHPPPPPQNVTYRPVNSAPSQSPPQDVVSGVGFSNYKYCGLRSIIIANRILGGTQAGLHEFPWMARLYMGIGRNESLNCAGTLINERYVLTAAHCVPTYEPTPLMSVHLGQHGVTSTPDCDQSEDSKPCEPPPQEVDVEEIFVHPQYTGCCQYFNDIALLRLAWAPQFTDFIRPVCLPVDKSERTKYLDKSRLVVTGWGTTEEDVNSPVLLKVSVPVVPNSECQPALKEYQCEITEGQICAGGELEQDSCNGDSGGPLVGPGTVGVEDRMVQYGVVSYGGDDGCGVKGKPAVYTRVGKYMDWISDTIFP